AASDMTTLHGGVVRAVVDEARRLEHEHRGVAPAQRHQVVVAALFQDVPVCEDDNAVCPADGGEAVRDDHGGQAVGDVQEAVVKRRLGAYVQVRRRLV